MRNSCARHAVTGIVCLIFAPEQADIQLGYTKKPININLPICIHIVGLEDLRDVLLSEQNPKRFGFDTKLS